MSLLREIQASLMQGQAIGPILLKLRLLASRLGSGLLEEWVKHESEGYPTGVEVPSYRKIGMPYRGTFSGPFGSGVKNAPIPPYLVEKYAGSNWASQEMRQSVAAIDELVVLAKDSEGTLRIDASNLILLLQGKVYEDYACNSVWGTISAASLTEIQNAVRNRILELTIQIEKAIPTAADIGVGPPATKITTKEPETVTQITNQVINGNVTSISNVGDGAHFSFNITEGDGDAFVKALVKSGIAKPDAQALAKILASEKAESKTEPFGTKAKAWIVANIGKATDGTWKAGMAVATKVLTEAALKYYGFK